MRSDLVCQHGGSERAAKSPLVTADATTAALKLDCFKQLSGHDGNESARSQWVGKRFHNVLISRSYRRPKWRDFRPLLTIDHRFTKAIHSSSQPRTAYHEKNSDSFHVAPAPI